ncbi:MAG: hypothetical protein KGI35_07685, partial [Burkholderiales bacterium]|nr:hypothetical protein [Burkholderiales bacterium]
MQEERLTWPAGPPCGGDRAPEFGPDGRFYAADALKFRLREPKTPLGSSDDFPQHLMPIPLVKRLRAAMRAAAAAFAA